MAPVPPGLTTALQDRYRLDRELGKGGMATVYLAHDLRNNRPVALKLLRPELAAILGAERFLKEIETTANLQHPHILPLFDSGRTGAPADGGAGDFLYYVMPFVEGESLRDRLNREKQLPIDEALRLATEIAGALDYAHQQGVIHRDIKPENILLSRGHALVADFGIALAVREAGGERLTETGLSIGTPQYMSPEQATAERQLDARSDIYSLGAVLYEMLAGEPPFTGATGQAVIAKLMTERPTRLRIVRATVPDAVDDAVARALAKVPADRFPTAATFAAALRSPASPGSRTSNRPRPSKSWRAAAGAGLVAATLMGIWLRFGAALGVHRPPADPEVVALYQRGLRGLGRRTPAGFTDAMAAFGAAVKRDSTYSRAWNGLAKSYLQAYGRAFALPGVPRDSLLRLALSAVERAFASDSSSGDTWLTQAMLSRRIDPTDFGPVLRSLRQAIALDSTNAQAWQQFAIALAETGDFNGGLAAWRHCVTLDPSYNEGLAFLALGHYWRRQYDSASKWADSAVAVDPNYLLGRTTVGFVAVERGEYDRGFAAFEAARRLTNDVDALNSVALDALAEARAGRRAEARARLREAESQAKAFSPASLHTAIDMAEAYAALGDVEKAVAWLARFQPRASLHFQLHLRCDPPLDPLLGDPRFQSLLTLPRPPKGTGC